MWTIRMLQVIDLKKVMPWKMPTKKMPAYSSTINNREHPSIINHLWYILSSLSNSNEVFVAFFASAAEEEDKQNDTDATRNVEIDNVLNQLIDDTTMAVGNKNVARQHRGGKNSKRHHKNGGAARSHAKAQNNGKHINGAHLQCESQSAEAAAAAEASNHHVNTFHAFTVTETAADHTQTDWNLFTNCIANILWVIIVAQSDLYKYFIFFFSFLFLYFWLWLPLVFSSVSSCFSLSLAQCVSVCVCVFFSLLDQFQYYTHDSVK